MLTLHSVRVSFGSFSTGHRHNEASSVRRFETVAAAFLSRRALEHSAHSGHSPHTWPFLLTKHGLPRNKDIRLTSSFFYPVNWTLFHLSQSPPSSFIRNIPLFVCAATRLNYSCPTPPSGWWMNQKISTNLHLLGQLFPFSNGLKWRAWIIWTNLALTTLAPSGGVRQHPIVPAASVMATL